MSTDAPDRPFRRRVLTNTAAVLAANGWSMALALISLPLLLEGLGSAAFGLWVLLGTFSAVNGWLSLLDAGFGTAGTREIAGRHGAGDDTHLGPAVGTTVAVLAGLGVLAGAAFALVGPVVLPSLFNAPDDLVDDLQVAIVAFGAQAAVDLLAGGMLAVLDGLQRVDRARAVDVARRTAVAAATVVAALATGDLAAVALASLAASVLGAAVAAVATRATLRAEAPGVRLAASRATASALFHYGKRVAVLRPLGVLHRTVDRLVVGIILGPAAVSLVEVATQVQNGADAVLSATSYSVVPTAARLQAHQRPDALRELLGSGTRLSLLATLPVVTLAAVLAGPLIDVWVGDEYAEAAQLVALACVALAILACAQVASNLLLGVGRAGTIARVALAAIAFNVAASVALVHAIGVAGAFWATIGAACITTPLLLVAVGRHLDVEVPALLREAVAPAVGPAAAGGVAAALVLAAPLGSLATLVVGGALGLAVTAAVAFRWGLVPSERQAAQRALARLRSR